MTEGYDLEECLAAVDPAACSYEEWLHAGMALHAEGMPLALWDDWSRRDAARYKDGECARKWRGFGRGPDEVKGGTLVQMARDAGWSPAWDKGEAFGWDVTEVQGGPSAPGRIVDPTWVESAELAEPGEEWRGSDDLIAYLEALFDPGEVGGYVVESWDNEGRRVPSGKGPHTETAGEIVERVRKYGDDLASSIGWNDEDGGAWIRFNPLDGNGVRNDNVAEYRYALVESDDMSVGRQLAIMRELELPAAAIVHSGGKSVHAVVHVDAKDYDEYRKRVVLLYSTCRENGLKVDTQNKNPSRLSRMPGVTRAGRKQWLVATDAGKASWAEWREWIDEQNDDLPDPESLADCWDALPELSPPLIEGVLRQGHKMMLGGPSKAGKSFALIELCVSIAEGVPWLGFGCAQGRVLYVLELDRASCLHRSATSGADRAGEPGQHRRVEPARKSKPMDQLAPSLIRRALKTRPIAVVIDRFTGDHRRRTRPTRWPRSATSSTVARVGCAVVYCHHHSRAARAQALHGPRGVSVFARDPTRCST
ncbi:MAG: PriCT-2 domain-containing protein [Eggerthella lenta]